MFISKLIYLYYHTGLTFRLNGETRGHSLHGSVKKKRTHKHYVHKACILCLEKINRIEKQKLIILVKQNTSPMYFDS